MPITKFRRAPGQLTVLTVLGFVTGLLALVALAQQADAQKGGEIERPQIEIRPAPPDLEVAVTVPAQIAYTGQGMVQVRVDNTLLIKPSAIPGAPGYLAGSAANGVLVRVMFSRLEPLTVQGGSGLQCVLRAGSAIPPWAFVDCTGDIPAGGAATISISVKESSIYNCPDFCGPVYTDARVDVFNTIAERSETNNRALGVTDVINCIN